LAHVIHNKNDIMAEGIFFLKGLFISQVTIRETEPPGINICLLRDLLKLQAIVRASKSL
jgi:hypothetical protein